MIERLKNVTDYKLVCNKNLFRLMEYWVIKCISVEFVNKEEFMLRLF